MVGIGIIGTGYWGKNHVRIYANLLKNNKIDYLKICDIDKERVKELSESYSLDYTTNIMDILKDNNISAVVIVTPSSTHYELTKIALNYDKDVFVEKPITLESNDALELIKMAKERKKILMVGHLFRYHPLVTHIKRKIDNGEFGKIEMIITFRFALGVPRTDMGVILALAIHDIDLTCYLLNKKKPESILVDTGKFHQDKVEEMAAISLTFDDNIKGYILASWNIPVYDKKRELIVIGSDKSAIINYLNPSEYYIYDERLKKKIINGNTILEKENGQINKITIKYKEPLKQEIMHFIKCVKTRKDPKTNGYVGYHAVRMCETAFQSVKENKRIYFNEVEKWLKTII
ncbi:MAG: Gfo/Idh/MocA family protein [Promethearchaeota archaeon]